MAEFRGWGGAAIVTGASGGIGLELAKLLASRGMDLILVARSADNLRILANRLEQQHRVRAIPLAVDLAAPDAAAALPEAFRDVDLTVDLLVNNAGFGVFGPFGNQGIAREAEMIRLNTIAPTVLTGLFLPGMLRRRRGRILNIASTAAFAPVPWLATYAATKAHLVSWTHALDTELAGTGVRVCVCCPGTVRTRFLEVSGAATMREHALPASQPAHVAEACLRGLDRGRRVVVVGMLNRLHRAAAAVTPPAWAAGIAASVNRPKGPTRSRRAE